MSQIQAWTASQANQPLSLQSFDLGELAAEEVEIQVQHCGICHSDLSVWHNDWGISRYPIVLGHEAVGTVKAIGSAVRGLTVGQKVGVGWNAGSCMHCHPCLNGEGNLCHHAQPTMIGHHGGFADTIRSHWLWAIPIPQTLDVSRAGPLLCGGITVFAPLSVFNVKPTDRVGIVGIGGLGHMAIKFARAWGCEVTAFTSSSSKMDEAYELGAHRVISTYDQTAIQRAVNSIDFLLITVNVSLEWTGLLKTLKPNGRMHVVGAVLEPLAIPAVELLFGQKSVSASPTGSPAMMATMLDFADRHQILPEVEHFPMSAVNEAFEHLAAGKARYRIVLDADFNY
ncbi:MAG: hypothetical protein RL637_501 [Pseudomonadota bacterium]